MTDGETELRFAELMMCPNCGATIPPGGYNEAPYENSDGVVLWEATWTCQVCEHVARDWEDEFVSQKEPYQ